jgi:hypothetical protein
MSRSITPRKMISSVAEMKRSVASAASKTKIYSGIVFDVGMRSNAS